MDKKKRVLLKLNIPTKTIKDLWVEYGPELSKYYNIMKYKEDEIVHVIKNVSKGSNKSIDMEGAKDGTIYAVTYASVNEIEMHMKILLEFLKHKDFEFDIPLIYMGESEYITSYITFDKEQNTTAKKFKYSIAEKQFINFMLNDMNMIPNDVESYISRAGILTFLDFGEVKAILNPEMRKTYRDNYQSTQRQN